MLDITILTGNVTKIECDVLVLKYAQAFYGGDKAVVDMLGEIIPGNVPLRLAPREHLLLESKGQVPAVQVLFWGVVNITKFSYSEIRTFVRDSLVFIHSNVPHAESVAMTMHGVGFGLDERESFLAQLGGISDAISAGVKALKISIVERDRERAERMRTIMAESWHHVADSPHALAEPQKTYTSTARITAGTASSSKPHVFVAMPYSKELEDVYVFGIQNPINSAGYLCERVDMASFTGDILDRIKTRIETAALVIADLTGANPNVYLEVGYAWGKNRPTLLLARRSEELKFDVRGQRCIVYENIVDLAKRLQQDLATLETN